MEPLVTLLVVTAGLNAAGIAGVRRLRAMRRFPVALRGGVAAMFVLTGGAHFVGMRDQMIAMVPPGLPSPELLVTVTGVLELAGAVGIVWSRTSTLAAACLSALLVAMFPANVFAATSGLVTAWYDELLPRTLMQLIFLSATVAVTIDRMRQARRRTVATTGATSRGLSEGVPVPR